MASKQDFWDLADLQRNEPEAAMRRVQEVAGGGVLSFVVEHTGDLIHRMSEKNTWEYGGHPYVAEKVRRVLRTLKNPYGFLREHDENMQATARYYGIDEEVVRSHLDKALRAYRKAHMSLPIYNEAQFLATRAVVAISNLNVEQAVSDLETLQEHLKDPDEWVEYAHQGLGRRK